MMKALIFALGVVFAFGGVSAQQATWQPSAGHTQVPIWPGAVPDAQPVAGPEVAAMAKGLIAGKSREFVVNVAQPTMTVYLPEAKNTGAAVIVFPGGGYQDLAIDLEGTEVCDWLTPKGITCVLLKYRVPDSGPDRPEDAVDQRLGKTPNTTSQRTGVLLVYCHTSNHVRPFRSREHSCLKYGAWLSSQDRSVQTVSRVKGSRKRRCFYSSTNSPSLFSEIWGTGLKGTASL